MLIQKGTLYIVATPIGNLGDITLRAIEILKGVDIIAAEDTRHSRTLLAHYDITTPVFSLHNYNEQSKIKTVLTLLGQKKSVALISDAGTPLISDPGYRVTLKAIEKQFKVTPIPGVSALISSLSVAGLPTDRFCFEGFLAAKSSLRKKQLLTLAKESRTIVFYEAPHRIIASLKEMIKVFGKERKAVIARELTKKFEQIIHATLGDLLDECQNSTIPIKGEFVILVHGYQEKKSSNKHQQHIEKILQVHLKELSLKKAVELTQKITGEARSKIYKLALELKKEVS